MVDFFRRIPLLKQSGFMCFHQIILRSTVLFSVFLTFFVNAQVSIPQVFQTSDNFDLFVKSITNESNNELSDESKQSIRYDSFTPAFDESGQFKSITLEYSGGKQCVIQRVSGNEFVIQKEKRNSENDVIPFHWNRGSPTPIKAYGYGIKPGLTLNKWPELLHPLLPYSKIDAVVENR